MENFEQENTPAELEKRSENKVTMLLEQTIDELSNKPQTPENIAEIQKYQEKLANHLNKLSKKYDVAADNGDAFDKAMSADPTDRATRRGL